MSANMRMRSKHIHHSTSIQMYNMYTYDNYVYCARTRTCAWIYTPCMQSTHNQMHMWWRWWYTMCILYTVYKPLWPLHLCAKKGSHFPATFQRCSKLALRHPWDVSRSSQTSLHRLTSPVATQAIQLAAPRHTKIFRWETENKRRFNCP